MASVVAADCMQWVEEWRLGISPLPLSRYAHLEMEYGMSVKLSHHYKIISSKIKDHANHSSHRQSVEWAASASLQCIRNRVETKRERRILGWKKDRNNWQWDLCFTQVSRVAHASTFSFYGESSSKNQYKTHTVFAFTLIFVCSNCSQRRLYL